MAARANRCHGPGARIKHKIRTDYERELLNARIRKEMKAQARAKKEKEFHGQLQKQIESERQ